MAGFPTFEVIDPEVSAASMKYGLDEGGQSPGLNDRHEAGSASAVEGASSAAAAAASAPARDQEESAWLIRLCMVGVLLLTTSDPR